MSNDDYKVDADGVQRSFRGTSSGFTREIADDYDAEDPATHPIDCTCFLCIPGA